jgi:hypothetical protein
MKLQMLIAADYASVDTRSHKLNILGAFTRISAKQFPAIHQRLALALMLIAELGDTSDSKELTVDLVDADGNELIRLVGEFSIPSQAGKRPPLALVMEINNLRFPHAGEYTFNVYVDDVLLDETDITLEMV